MKRERIGRHTMNPPDAHPVPRQWPPPPHGQPPLADFPLDRITDALLLLPSSSRTSDATYPRDQSASNVASREGQK
jgi:hypothetical protein